MTVDQPAELIWQPDLHRYIADESYADEIDTFVRGHVKGGSVEDAIVVEASDGTRALITTTMLEAVPHLEFIRDASGRVTRGQRIHPLEPGENLP